jgi:hypothetical protein
MNWKTLVAGLLLLAVALVHALRPQFMSLDWPTITLLIAGVLFCFSRPLTGFLPYVKRLKLGEAEIEIREKLSVLTADIVQLEEQIPKKGLPLHISISNASPT